MKLKVFVLTPFIQSILRGRGLLKPCRNCGYAFQLGDVIVSKHGGSNKMWWYCRKCAIKLRLI